MITYLAHDLKTPLTSVIGYLSLLDEVPDMPQAQKEKYIHITLDKANRLEKLINEFFEITRYNLQQIILEKEMVDLYYMLIQMSDEFYPILASHGNTITLHAQEDLTVYADPTKLARVFNNILKNAIAYSYPNTDIQITAVKTEQEIRISVCNHGKTIPQQRLESIFEKFFRLDDARTTNTGGAGLGLAIAKEIVTLHGVKPSRQPVRTNLLLFVLRFLFLNFIKNQDSLYFFLGNQQLNIKVKNAFVSYNDKRNKGVLHYVQGEIMEYGKKEVSKQTNTKKSKKTF